MTPGFHSPEHREIIEAEFAACGDGMESISVGPEEFGAIETERIELPSSELIGFGSKGSLNITFFPLLERLCFTLW